MTSVPSSIFDHIVWLLQSIDGTWQRGKISLGECVLLFTSLDSLNDFLNACDESTRPQLRAVVFSTNRKEFGKQAKRAAQSGIIGALFDPEPDTGTAPFLRFAKPSN